MENLSLDVDNRLELLIRLNHFRPWSRKTMREVYTYIHLQLTPSMTDGISSIEIGTGNCEEEETKRQDHP